MMGKTVRIWLPYDSNYLGVFGAHGFKLWVEGWHFPVGEFDEAEMMRVDNGVFFRFNLEPADDKLAGIMRDQLSAWDGKVVSPAKWSNRRLNRGNRRPGMR